MSDSSTTARLILDLIAGECWAQRQLCSGIKDVSVASKPMKSLTLVGVVFIGTLAFPDLDGRFLHDRWTNPESDCGRLSGTMPATQLYKTDPSASFIYNITGLNGMGCWRSQNLMADYSTIVFVTGQGGAGFHFVTPPLLRPGVNSLPFLLAPYDTGPWPGCGAGRVFYFPR